MTVKSGNTTSSIFRKIGRYLLELEKRAAMNIQDFIQSIESTDLRVVANHWCEARGDALMPSWEQIRPSRISAQLPLVWAYKYHRQTGQFTGRLASNRITQGFRKNFRGLRLEEAHPSDSLPWILQYMTRVVSEPTAYRTIGKLFKRGDRIIEGERIAFPLAVDGIHGDGVLGASSFQSVHWGSDDSPVELLTDNELWLPLAPTRATELTVNQE